MNAVLSRTSAGLLAKVSILLSLTLLIGGWGAYEFHTVTSTWEILGIFVAVLVGIFVVQIADHSVGASLGIPLLLVWAFGVGAMTGPAFAHYVKDLGWETVEMVFVFSAGVMCVLGALGALCSRNLAGWGSILLLSLFGLIIAQVVSAFLPHVAHMQMLYGFIGAIIFAGYFIYDFNQASRDADTWEAAVEHTMSIFLDFVNFMLSVLQILDDDK